MKKSQLKAIIKECILEEASNDTKKIHAVGASFAALVSNIQTLIDSDWGSSGDNLKTIAPVKKDALRLKKYWEKNVNAKI